VKHRSESGFCDSSFAERRNKWFVLRAKFGRRWSQRRQRPSKNIQFAFTFEHFSTTFLHPPSPSSWPVSQVIPNQSFYPPIQSAPTLRTSPSPHQTHALPKRIAHPNSRRSRSSSRTRCRRQTLIRKLEARTKIAEEDKGLSTSTTLTTAFPSKTRLTLSDEENTRVKASQNTLPSFLRTVWDAIAANIASTRLLLPMLFLRLLLVLFVGETLWM